MSLEMATKDNVLGANSTLQTVSLSCFVFYLFFCSNRSPISSNIPPPPQNNETHNINPTRSMKHFESLAAYTHRTKNTAPHNCSAYKTQIEF